MNDNNDYPFTSTYPDTASAPEQSDGDVPTNIVPPLNGQPKYEMEGESTTPYVAVSDTATNPATSTATTTPPHTFEAYDDGINNMPSSCSDRCQPLLFMEMEASVASSSGESRSIASSISSRVSSSLSAIANEAKKLRKKAKKKRKKDADPNATSSSADSKRRVLSKSAKLFALCAALNSCNLGYDIGVSTEAGRLIQDDWGLTTMERELFTGSLNFWASKFLGFWRLCLCDISKLYTLMDLPLSFPTSLRGFTSLFIKCLVPSIPIRFRINMDGG